MNMKNIENHCKNFARVAIPLVFLTLLSSSCKFDTIVNIDLPKHKPVIVVNSFFNPDSIWKVTLMRSQGALENGRTQKITDATVEIWEGGQRVAELAHIGKGVYRAKDSKPQPGKMYELRATAPGYPSVSARDMIPQKVAISKIKIDTLKMKEYTELELSILFTDPPGRDGKYHVAVWAWFPNENREMMYGPIHFSSTDLLFNEGVSDAMDNEFFDTQGVFDDALLAGKPYTLKLRISGVYANIEEETAVVLSTVSNAYYTYYRTRLKYEDNDGDPFAEPVLVYNNVEKGLGIFAGYNSFVYKLSRNLIIAE